MRIGFLFNHDHIHQIAHSLPIALALKRMVPTLDVQIAVTSGVLAAEVARLAARLGAACPPIRHLEVRSNRTRQLQRLLGRLVPVSKLMVYGDNLDYFRSLDMLVVPEKTSLVLKTRYGLKDLVMVHTRHGAGDRALGFNPESAMFDHVLVAGTKYRDRLVSDTGMDPARIHIIGYPKFDLWLAAPPEPLFPDSSRPTVLYNPHFSPHLSSWFKMGRDVLEHFRRSDRYNLIVAPHVMLFVRPVVVTIDKLSIARVGRLPEWLADTPHIKVDTGSAACTDMTYTNAADIYMGDVSSQLYEFMVRPRPCVFLNAHGIPWKGDPSYIHWDTGPVIDRVADLDRALDQAQGDFARYRVVQEGLCRSTFDTSPIPAGERGARALLDIMGQRESQLPKVA